MPNVVECPSCSEMYDLDFNEVCPQCGVKTHISKQKMEDETSYFDDLEDTNEEDKDEAVQENMSRQKQEEDYRNNPKYREDNDPLYYEEDGSNPNRHNPDEADTDDGKFPYGAGYGEDGDLTDNELGLTQM